MTWLVQTNKGGGKRRAKALRRQREVRRFTRFVDHGLMLSVAKCRGSWVVGRGRGCGSWVWVWVNVVGKKRMEKNYKK